MATLADVWASLFPAARPVVPLHADALNREVGWARVLKARVPAFDALDPGDLAIVPAGALLAVAPGPPEAASLVAEFARARVSALLLLESDVVAVSDPAIEALGSAAAGAGLPAFRAARLDPVAIERSTIGYLVNRRAELDRQAALLEGRLETLALEGSDLVGLLGAIGGWLGRAVALEGQRGDALAVHSPADLPEGAAAVRAYLSNRRKVALRVPLPAAPSVGPTGATAGPSTRHLPRRSGSLVLLGDRPGSELERVVTTRIAGLLALELARTDSRDRASDRGGRGDALPLDGPPWVVLVAEQAPIDSAPSIEQREQLRRELRLLAPARRLTLRGDATSVELRLVLAVDAADPHGLVLAGMIGRFIDRTVAVSRPFSDAVERPAADAAARDTLLAARSLAAPPAIARAELTPAYRLLGALHNLPDGVRQATALLDPLLGGHAPATSTRLETLRAVLEQPGPGEAAAALGIHRNTVAYRVRRIEAMTGWDLSDPALQLALAIALRLVQGAQDARLN